MKKKLLIIATALVFSFSLFGVLKFNAVAQNKVDTIKIYSDLNEITYEKDKEYAFVVKTAENSNLGGFYLKFTMPDFVAVSEVTVGQLSEKDATFDSEINGNTVSVICNMGEAVTENISLFSVKYTIKEEKENQGEIIVNESLFSTVEVEPLKSDFDFKNIIVSVEEKVLKGDFNFDEVIDEKDLIAMQRAILTGSTISAEQLEVGDIDGDKKITLFDCQYVKAYLVGRFTTLNSVDSGSDEIVLNVVIYVDERQPSVKVNAKIGDKYYSVLEQYLVYDGYELDEVTRGRETINEDDTVIDSDDVISIMFKMNNGQYYS